MNTSKGDKHFDELAVPLLGVQDHPSPRITPHVLNGQTDDMTIPFVDDEDQSQNQSQIDVPVVVHIDERLTESDRSSSPESLSNMGAVGGIAIDDDDDTNDDSLRRENALDQKQWQNKKKEEEEETPSTDDHNFIPMQQSDQRENVVDNEFELFDADRPPIPIVTVEDCDDDSNDDFYKEIGRKKRIIRDPFRTKRRASIAPLPALRLNNFEMSDIEGDFDSFSIPSNQASVTSINSIASLLKEKVQTLPQKVRERKRETKDFGTKIFVLIQFIMILFLITLAHVVHYRKLQTTSYFDKMRLKMTDRIFRILNHEDKEVITGFLGTTIGWYKNPYHCHVADRMDDGSICLEWDGRARMYMNYKDMDVFRCYTLKWQATREGIYPTDCYELRRNNGLWFGGGITKSMDWAISMGNFTFSPLVSGDVRIHQFGNGVKRYFINSNGVAIQVSDKTPLYVSVNHKENQFCLRAMNDDFSYVNRMSRLPELEYKICTTEDMRSLHMLMTQRSLWDGLKESDIKKLHSIIEEPIWNIPYGSDRSTVNETIIYDYSEDIIAMGFMRLGHIVVNEFWQENVGDFTLDRKRFPTMIDTIDVLHRRGFKIVFTIQPFISTDSPNFKDAVAKKLLIYERFSEHSIPALTRFKSCSSAGVLDITNNASVTWLREKLTALQKEFQVDAFYLDLGTGYNLPHYYQCNQTLINPDTYARIFISNFEGKLEFIGVSTASTVPKPPTFLSIPPTNSSWQGLQEIVATVVNYGIIGYPFILPGATGGDHRLDNEMKKMVSFYSYGQAQLPEEELFVRWLQLMAFLPTMQFSHLPTDYKSEYIIEITKELIAIRQKSVIPMLKKYLSESMNEGLPLVRPLWMLDPHDPACLSVSDEFSIGEELIVAPILQKGLEAREVYLPQGLWKDGIDNSLRKGSRWLHLYKVPKRKIAYFVKMPNNTRF